MTSGARAVVMAAALALSACDTIDLGEPPAGVNACRPGQQFFLDQIWDNVLHKDYGGKRCADSACHDAGSGRQLVLTAPVSARALPLPADWLAVYTSASEQMQCSNVRASELLTRGSGLRTHGGGRLFDPTGPEATLLERWVTEP